MEHSRREPVGELTGVDPTDLALPPKPKKGIPMKKIALSFALALSSLSLALGPLSTDANGGARKICKQELKTHPMAGEHRDLMKQCKAEYKAQKKAGRARAT